MYWALALTLCTNTGSNAVHDNYFLAHPRRGLAIGCSGSCTPGVTEYLRCVSGPAKEVLQDCRNFAGHCPSLDIRCTISGDYLRWSVAPRGCLDVIENECEDTGAQFRLLWGLIIAIEILSPIVLSASVRTLFTDATLSVTKGRRFFRISHLCVLLFVLLVNVFSALVGTTVIVAGAMKERFHFASILGLSEHFSCCITDEGIFFGAFVPFTIAQWAYCAHLAHRFARFTYVNCCPALGLSLDDEAPTTNELPQPLLAQHAVQQAVQPEAVVVVGAPVQQAVHCTVQQQQTVQLSPVPQTAPGNPWDSVRQERDRQAALAPTSAPQS